MTPVAIPAPRFRRGDLVQCGACRHAFVAHARPPLACRRCRGLEIVPLG